MEIKIAITGNIASGKTEVQKILEKDFLVFDTDLIAHKKLEELTSFEGLDVFTNGKIDRKKLGNIVFSNAELKQKLENIIHPKVKEEVLKIFEENKDKDVIIVAVPLLYETDFYQLFDKVLLVVADDDIRLSRLMTRNNLSKEDALIRMNAQISQEEKIAKSNFVIKNNASKKELEEQVLVFIRKLHCFK